jgi:hypothetical protein
VRIQEGEEMKLVLCIIAADALTQLACKGEIFDSLREWLKSLTRFTFLLLSCSYCVSVWVAASVTIMYFTWEYSQFFIIGLVIHRISNFVHDLFRVVQNYKIDQILNRIKEG